jgi:uncharacterized protein
MRSLFLAVVTSGFLYGGALHDHAFNADLPKLQEHLRLHKGVDEPNAAGLSALHVAIKMGDLKIAEILVKNGADIDFQDNNGNTPLILAVKKKDLELVTFVVLKGADVNLANNDGVTPLHQAAFSGNEKVVDFLLKAKADPHLKNNDGASAYDFAIAKGYLNIAQLIKMSM